MLVAMAVAVAGVAASLVFRHRRRRRRAIPDELRPVIIEEALRRARTKQQAAFQDAQLHHHRAS